MELLTQNAKLKATSKAINKKVLNFGIPAYKTSSGKLTCPMAKECIKFCYAQKGAYNWGNVKPVYEWLVNNEIPFDDVNPKTGDEFHSPKLFAEYYIDDRALRFTSWKAVHDFIEEDTSDNEDKTLFSSGWFKRS